MCVGDCRIDERRPAGLHLEPARVRLGVGPARLQGQQEVHHPRPAVRTALRHRCVLDTIITFCLCVCVYV